MQTYTIFINDIDSGTVKASDIKTFLVKYYPTFKHKINHGKKEVRLSVDVLELLQQRFFTKK